MENGCKPLTSVMGYLTNYFHPETAQAAVEVLEAAGYQIAVPQQALCCGRPLSDYGMLDTAKRWLRQIIETLRPEIEAGTRSSAWSQAA
jgi:Fe-S oxidoreductase